MRESPAFCVEGVLVYKEATRKPGSGEDLVSDLRIQWFWAFSG